MTDRGGGQEGVTDGGGGGGASLLPYRPADVPDSCDNDDRQLNSLETRLSR